MRTIKEIRTVTHLPDIGVAVVLIFEDGTSSAHENIFKTKEAAKSFIDGIRQGFAWQKKGFKLVKEI